MRERALLSGVLEGKEPPSWMHRRPQLRKETGPLWNHRGLGGTRGSWPGTLGTRNVKPQKTFPMG